ncbi:MAG: filamentous hemagglutinin N-terminal domain-containing protein, partial [Cyanobacteria bacterium P01_A01_bin.84]
MFFHKINRKLVNQLIILAAILSGTDKAFAQEILPDNTLPNNSQIKIENNITKITGGTRRGGNLFHSFEKFGIPTGREAHFNNNLDVNNIINRVTGGSTSNIDGLIKANGTANLFLINPSGIVFGKNAKLDIGGSFVGTTANALGFGEDNFFSASNPEKSSLLTINPNALFFNQLNQKAAIKNNSVAPSGRNPSDDFTARGLRVPDGKSLLLVGGDINLDGGRLYAFGGRVELGGLSDTGTVGLNIDGDGNKFSLKFPDAVTRSDVNLNNDARVNVRAGNGGSIAVNAQNLQINEDSELWTGIEKGLGSEQSQAGNIDIDVTGEIKLDNESGIRNDVRSQAKGQGGDVNINTSKLLVLNGSVIGSGTFGFGNGGNLNIQAKNIELIRGDAGITGLFARANSNSTGNAGDLNIITNSLEVLNGASVSTSVASDSTGDGGNLKIQTDSLVVKNGSLVNVSTRGDGKGGNLTIEAK